MRPKSKQNQQPERVMSFGEHLEELRRRLILAILGVAPILIGSMFVADWVIELLTRPVIERQLADQQGRHMIVTGMLEHFNSYFYVGLILTLLIGSPWLLYQLWLFVAPGLYLRERRFVHILAPMSIALALLSAAFTYYVMLPAILQFFSHWNSSVPGPPVASAPLPEGVVLPALPVLQHDPVNPAPGSMWVNSTISEMRVCIKPGDGGTPPVIRGSTLLGDNLVKQELRVAQYVDMVFNFALAFAAGFQMPVVVMLLGWVGLVKVAHLKKYRRHAIFGCALLGAFLTPGDPLSAALLGVPLYLLYEFGVLMLVWLPASRVRGDDPEDQSEPTPAEPGVQP
ncbi:MAG: twin-arginine translocase subunit TatC [Phycisphaerales bacterium]